MGGQIFFGSLWVPFGVKIFFAPILDTKFIEGIGKRKTWILGTTFLVELF